MPNELDNPLPSENSKLKSVKKVLKYIIIALYFLYILGSIYTLIWNFLEIGIDQAVLKFINILGSLAFLLIPIEFVLVSINHWRNNQKMKVLSAFGWLLIKLLVLFFFFAITTFLWNTNV